MLGAAFIAFLGTYYKARIDADAAKDSEQAQKELLKEKAAVDREIAIRAALAELRPPVSSELYNLVARTRAYAVPAHEILPAGGPFVRTPAPA